MKRVLLITMTGFFLICFSQDATSQNQRRDNYRIDKIYVGLEMLAGARLLPNAVGHIQQLQNHDVGGGSFGMMVGKNHWSAHIRGAGYYAAPLNEGSPLRIFESQALFDFHILKYLKTQSRFDIYPTFGGGLVFYEFEQPTTSGKNACIDKTVLRLNMGAGVLYKVVDKYSFVHIFAEFYMSPALTSEPSEIDLVENATRQVTMLNAGIRFGRVFSR